MARPPGDDGGDGVVRRRGPNQPAGRGRRGEIQVTHRFVKNPEAVAQGIELWVSLLAEAVRRQLLLPEEPASLRPRQQRRRTSRRPARRRAEAPPGGGPGGG